MCWPKRSSLRGGIAGRACGGDFRGRLGRQGQVHAVDQQAQFGLGFGVAGQHDLAPVGGRQMHVDHLDGGELRQRAAGGEAWGEAVQAAGQGDLQAVGEEGDEDMGFDAPFVVMEDRTDREVALQVLERLFDCDELDVVLPDEQQDPVSVRLVRNRYRPSRRRAIRSFPRSSE